MRRGRSQGGRRQGEVGREETEKSREVCREREESRMGESLQCGIHLILNKSLDQALQLHIHTHTHTHIHIHTSPYTHHHSDQTTPSITVPGSLP